MEIITEDYVSFAIAKLLKEKGFDCSCEHQYINCSSGHPFLTDIRDDAGCYYKNSEIGEDEYSAPTLQMAMKWLVQEYRRYVNVTPNVVDFYWTEKFDSYVEDLNKKYPLGKFIGTFNSTEEAANAAIKYCLEHFIK